MLADPGHGICQLPTRRAVVHRYVGIALGVIVFVAVVLFSRGRPATRLQDPANDRKSAPAARDDREEGPPATRPAAPSEPATPESQPSSPWVTRDASGKLTWPRPRTDDRQVERDRMVDSQIAADEPFRAAVTSGDVLAAMRTVPRHEFVPESRRDAAYADSPLPIGHGQTISQPYIVALMTELLAVKPGDKILEIGTGSGYQAAVLAELTPWVFSIEIVEPLHQRASNELEQLGYKTIRTKPADGYHGWPDAGPFDGIIVTCAAGHVPPPLWDQLKPGGRMVIPIGGTYDLQRLVILTKQSDGTRRSRTVLPVAFVPMTGRIQEP